MIAALPADQSGTAALAAGTVVTERNLQGRIDGLGTGVGEETLREASGRRCDNPFGQRHRLVVGHLK